MPFCNMKISVERIRRKSFDFHRDWHILFLLTTEESPKSASASGRLFFVEYFRYFSIMPPCQKSKSNISTPSPSEKSQESDSVVEPSHIISMPMSERSMSEHWSEDTSSYPTLIGSISPISGCSYVSLGEPHISYSPSREAEESSHRTLR